MKKLIEYFLKRNNIDLHNKTVCVGISTGVDSTVLLHALLVLKEEKNFNIILCHVNHGKREQSIIEEQYIKHYANINNLGLEILHLDLNEIENDNFQGAARMKRLQFFNQIMEKYNSNYFFLAHHLDDDIETSIMHIIRGSNLKGYSGIDEIVVNKEGRHILRPFLKIPKQDIIDYCCKNNLKYFEDESNSSDCYTRNRIRHNIVPLLFEENNNFYEQFLDFKDTLVNSYYIVCEQRDNYIINNVKLSDEIEINLESFHKLTNFMKKEVLFELLKKYQMSKNNIKEIMKLIDSEKPTLTINYKNINFCKQYNRVVISDYISNEKISKNEKINIIIDKLGKYDINDKFYLEVKTFTLEDYKKSENNLINLNVIWYNSSMLPICLRNRQDGDRIKINTGSKKVKDLLIDEKVPVHLRDNLLMLVKDDEIINIFGVKKSSTLLNTRNNNILIELREK